MERLPQSSFGRTLALAGADAVRSAEHVQEVQGVRLVRQRDAPLPIRGQSRKGRRTARHLADSIEEHFGHAASTAFTWAQFAFLARGNRPARGHNGPLAPPFAFPAPTSIRTPVHESRVACGFSAPRGSPLRSQCGGAADCVEGGSSVSRVSDEALSGLLLGRETEGRLRRGQTFGRLRRRAESGPLPR